MQDQTTTDVEEWRPVVGYEGIYSVSNLGRVRAEVRIQRNKLFRARILRPGLSHGYQQVFLTNHARVSRNERVHRLVLNAFRGPCPNGYEASHEDNDRANNHLNNLEWKPRAWNRAEPYRNGRTRGPYNAHEAARVQFTPEQYTDILALKGQRTERDVAKLYGVTHTTIGRIWRGLHWSQRGEH